MTAYILDTETTGLVDPEIVEAAWVVPTSPQDLTERASFLHRYRPSKAIELGALATHHILDEDVSGCSPSSDFSLPDDCQYIIGHNVDYDWKAIGSPQVQRICTLALSRHFWPHLDSHSQSAMIYHLERERARDLLHITHAALEDVRLCAIVLGHILKATMGTVGTWGQLWRLSEIARIPTRLHFGKHRGDAFTAVPRAYLQWIMKQPDMDPYVIEAARRAL
jgi:exodeoxyribonuclease X